MKKKIDSKKTAYLTITLLFLSFTCCSIGGLARYSSHTTPSSWIEGLVGIGIGGTVFFWGIWLLLLGIFTPSKKMEAYRKVIIILFSIIFMLAGLVAFYSGILHF